jgi:hypothetical protein
LRTELSLEEKEIRRNLKKYDIIKVAGNKYLILELKKKVAILFPIDIFLNEDSRDKLIPKLSLRYETIAGYQEVDQTELLYLLNENNSLIKKALHHLFYERE